MAFQPQAGSLLFELVLAPEPCLDGQLSVEYVEDRGHAIQGDAAQVSQWDFVVTSRARFEQHALKF